MDAKIKELTEKIFHEGVEKGNQEADAIVAKAKTQSDEMIQAARTEADRIVADARKQAAEVKKNAEGELKLYSAQMVDSVKSTITNAITGKVVDQNVKPAASNPEFMQQMIMQIVKNWKPGEAMVIETAQADELQKFFTANAKELMDREVKIEQVNGKVTDFTLKPADGSYKIVFGEEQLMNFFKSFLRPRLVEQLF